MDLRIGVEPGGVVVVIAAGKFVSCVLIWISGGWAGFVMDLFSVNMLC